MASILFAAGASVYYKVKDTKAKHRAERDAHNSSRFSELEKENTERIRRLSEPRLSQPRADPASNNPFRDATTAPTTRRMHSYANNPFDSTEDLTTDRRRGSSEVEEEVEEIRAPQYGSVGGDEKKSKKRTWGQSPRLGSLKPGGWGGKKNDMVVR